MPPQVIKNHTTGGACINEIAENPTIPARLPSNIQRITHDTIWISVKGPAQHLTKADKH